MQDFTHPSTGRVEEFQQRSIADPGHFFRIRYCQHRKNFIHTKCLWQSTAGNLGFQIMGRINCGDLLE